VLGDDALEYSTVSRWSKRIRDGQEEAGKSSESKPDQSGFV